MRWIPVAAWILTLTGVILSFVTLLGGLADTTEFAPIATFNISNLGLAEYHDPKSDLGKNISILIPPDVTNPASITKYLGVKDWYSMHYLSICSGFFAPLNSNPRFLTSIKVNITCIKRRSGYIFSFANFLEPELDQSVSSLIDDIEPKRKNYNTAPWINLWYGGIVFASLELILLPITFSGKRRVNMYAVFLALVASFLFVIASSLVTNQSVGIYRSGIGLFPKAFLGLTWTTTVCIMMTFCLMQAEWKFQIWTPVGEPIVMYWKPSAVNWFALRPPGSGKLKAYWDARHGI